MKSTKKIIAALLAVLMLAMMIPFTASAVGEKYNATITGKAGYSITIYKVATIGADGKYTSVSTDTAVKAAIESTSGIDNAVLFDACEAAPDSKLTVAQGMTEFTGTPAQVAFATNDAGIYYARVTGAPAGVTVKETGGTVFMLADSKDAQGNSMTTANPVISGKIKDGTPTVSKKIVDGSNRVDSVSANIGDTITFELKASVAGTTSEPLVSYVIKDSMAAQKFSNPAVVSVKLTDGSDVAVVSNVTDPTNISITVTDAYLDAAANGENTFYENDEVIVTLTAVLTDKAFIGRITPDDTNTAYADTTANYNKDSLEFENAYGSSTIPGNTVHVYTFNIPVEKQDATDSSKKLQNAEFTLVGLNKTVTTTADGSATFSGLKAGTYTVKETKAPNGYNLNSTEYTVVINIDGTITVGGTAVDKVIVPDPPVVMPATGGSGTAIFTIIGVSLLALGGVLLVVVKRKKASK